MSGAVLLKRDGGVATLTLSNPDRRNAISYEMYDRLEDVCLSLAEDPSARVLVLRGAGGSFAGGTDIRHFTQLSRGRQGVEYEAYMSRVQDAVLKLRIPVISVVQGSCVGGGLVLAAISDLVYCTPDARFGSPIASTLGNTLSARSLARLYECFGRRRTSEMLMTARLLRADEALAAGFVNGVVTEAELDERLAEVIARILACAPLSLRSFKEFERRIDAHVEEIRTDDVFADIYGSHDFHEGVESFLGKRRAQFQGK